MNKLEKPQLDDVAGPKARHKATLVMVGNVAVGGGAEHRRQGVMHDEIAGDHPE